MACVKALKSLGITRHPWPAPGTLSQTLTFPLFVAFHNISFLFFKVFIEFVTILLLFYVLVLWL